MMYAPKVGQIVRLNSPKSLDHLHKFEVVSVSDDGKFAEVKKPGPQFWKTYNEPVSKLVDGDALFD